MNIKRDAKNATIFGVCSGLAKHFGTDPLIVRLLFALATLGSFGLAAVIYIFLAILMPEDDDEEIIT